MYIFSSLKNNQIFCPVDCTYKDQIIDTLSSLSTKVKTIALVILSGLAAIYLISRFFISHQVSKKKNIELSNGQVNGSSDKQGVAAIVKKDIQSKNLLNHHWVHLELGAANYGLKGTFKLDNLDARGGHEKQFQPLYQTIDELINKQGPNGTIFLNDIDEKDCQYTCQRLRDYITKTYPASAIQVKYIVKDYQLINIPHDLERTQIESIHLKNPGNNQIEDDLLSPDWMKKMLDYSKTGFTIVTHKSGTMQRCLLESGKKGEGMGLRYEKSTQPSKYTYVFPDGTSVDKEWEEQTYEYSIRTSFPTECYTSQEMKERELKKAKIKSKLENSANQLVNQLNDTIAKHPDFPLIAAFAKSSTNNFLKIELPPLKRLDKIDNLDDPEVYKELLDTLTLQYLCKTTFFQERINIITQPLSSISQQHNFLYLKRWTSVKIPFEIWKRLGLGNAYKQMFRTNKDFWSSDKSLKIIYSELSALNQSSKIP